MEVDVLECEVEFVDNVVSECKEALEVSQEHALIPDWIVVEVTVDQLVCHDQLHRVDRIVVFLEGADQPYPLAPQVLILFVFSQHSPELSLFVFENLICTHQTLFEDQVDDEPPVFVQLLGLDLLLV